MLPITVLRIMMIISGLRTVVTGTGVKPRMTATGIIWMVISRQVKASTLHFPNSLRSEKMEPTDVLWMKMVSIVQQESLLLFMKFQRMVTVL